MGSPPKHKSLHRETQFPWRLLYQNLLVVLGHVPLQKAKVMLLVESKTGLKNQKSK
jgi:hypothetical protein